jgi:hypothetical protein
LSVENEATKPAVALRRHDAESFAHQTDEAQEERQAQKVENRRSGQIQPVFTPAFVKCIIPKRFHYFLKNVGLESLISNLTFALLLNIGLTKNRKPYLS